MTDIARHFVALAATFAATFGPAHLLTVPAISAADAPAGTAQDADADQQAESRRSYALTQRVAELLLIQRVGNPAGGTAAPPIELMTSPLLKFTNPVSGRIYGQTFLWLDRQRPIAATCVYEWYSPWVGVDVEMQSLTDQPFTVDWDGVRLWAPQTPGMIWKEMPGAPAVGKTAAARFQQMKQLAVRFGASLSDRRQVATAVSRQLRLLDRPLYRYSSPEQQVVDGALFCFVEANDPELLLLFEAQETASGPSWHYAAARMNCDGIKVTLDEKVIQTIEPVNEDRSLGVKQDYYLCSFSDWLRSRRKTLPSVELPAADEQPNDRSAP